MAGQLRNGRGTAEGFQRPHTAADQFVNDPLDEAVGNSSAVGPGSTRIEVSSTASADTGAVGNRCARGTVRGGA